MHANPVSLIQIQPTNVVRQRERRNLKMGNYRQMNKFKTVAIHPEQTVVAVKLCQVVLH